jgi:hypothetical protein
LNTIDSLASTVRTVGDARSNKVIPPSDTNDKTIDTGRIRTYAGEAQ